MIDKKKIKKVVAEIRERNEPQFDAITNCPYCERRNVEYEIDDGNVTMEIECFHCGKKYKAKIPKF
jgi:transcription elongation factor Elf1